MPNLFVMRHAKSDWDNSLPDFDRPLAERGHRNAARMAHWLEDEGFAPAKILTSSANRARTTARYIADHFGLGPDAFEARRDLYLASAAEWISTLSMHTGGDLLICGHNPGLDDLVESLAVGPIRLIADGKLMTTAAIAVFTISTWTEIATEGAVLETIARPRELD